MTLALRVIWLVGCGLSIGMAIACIVMLAVDPYNWMTWLLAIFWTLLAVAYSRRTLSRWGGP